MPIISYNQNLYFTMMAEPNLLPDPERLKSLVEEVFEELKRAAAQSVPAVAETTPRPVETPNPARAAAPSDNDSPQPGVAA